MTIFLYYPFFNNYFFKDPSPRLYLGPATQAYYPDNLPDRREGAGDQGGAQQALLQGGRRHGDEGTWSWNGFLQIYRRRGQSFKKLTNLRETLIISNWKNERRRQSFRLFLVITVVKRAFKFYHIGISGDMIYYSFYFIRQR